MLAAAMLVAAIAANCAPRNVLDAPSRPAGRLLAIGGALSDANADVYGRFVELARVTAGDRPPRVLIATASSLDEEAAVRGRSEVLARYCPECEIASISRPTPREETVMLIEKADAMFFTGGDQKRVTTRYLTEEGRDTPEAKAMRRLLARGGVIAGTSAGDAMMSDPMFLTGRSAEALGIRPTRARADDDPQTKLRVLPMGPQIGKGMNFVPWVITDSHFFERDRFGRLVAALEVSGKRLGLGVGENACVEINVVTGEVIGLTDAGSLLVDVSGLERDGLARSGVRALPIRKGQRVTVSNMPPLTTGRARPTKTQETPDEGSSDRGQARSWRFFLDASNPAGGEARLMRLDGYDQTAWPQGDGWAVVEITPHSGT